MKKPKRKPEPKFGVGEVVGEKRCELSRLHGTPHFVKIVRRRWGIAGWRYELEGRNAPYRGESELRPLTAKEKNCRHRHDR